MNEMVDLKKIIQQIAESKLKWHEKYIREIKV